MTSPALSAPPPNQSAAAGATGSERLRALAALPLAAAGARGPRLAARRRQAERAIDAAYQQLAELPRAVVERSRAAEWLLDNHYIVQRALRGLKEEFPPGFARRLRLVAAGSARGLPLAYVVAAEIVAIGQGTVDPDAIASAVGEVQRLRSFTIAELWALPALLRLALLEQLAAATAGAIAGTAESAAERQTAEASGRVIAGAVRSLRGLEAANWKQFFENASTVERILAQDPPGLYRHMDFDTRDRYRKAVEAIAARAGAADEEAVATAAIDLTRGYAAGRRNHVGYFLVADGRDELERVVGARPPVPERWRRWLLRHSTAVYLGGIGVLSAAILSALLGAIWPVLTAAAGAAAPWLALLALLAAVAPIVSVAVTVVNAALTRVLPPRALPQMEFSREIPRPWRTLVAVPALLADADEIDALLAALEIRFLANRDPELHFALLTDLCDAPQAEMADDDALVERAADGIAALNLRHGGDDRGPFHLLHRARRWNASEGCWMGWERKRGKLTELNRLILGEHSEFARQVGDDDFVTGVRFVIVLDADTDLPRDSASQLVGALAHPLNRAEFAGDSATVVAGYTVLQPRVEISPLSAGTSRFAALFSPAAGLDPYTLAVSDVYQDLFGEGNFIGKGIYDVADFCRSLHHVVPDNALLSHDLFEGLHGRAGLLSNIVLLEDFPSHYLAHARRLERWVRGDWQLLPWLGRLVPAPTGDSQPNRLSLIARWKIIDNLRRSLLAPALVLWLLIGWLFVPSAALAWTLAAVCVPGVPLLLDLPARLVALLPRWLRRRAAAPDLESLRSTLGSWLCDVAFLPHTAAVAATAIARTLVRVYVTRRHLLQWVSAAHTARALAGNSAGPWREMAAAPALALVVATLLALLRPESLPVAAPLLLLWLGAPPLARYLSQPAPAPAPDLQPADLLRLRMLARRTWSFFETFVGPADQWLPPDHFQEDPRGAPARRTSPTNIGCLQLATLAAADFGYRGVLSTALQLKNTFDTLDRMERHRGHFLNWYGTADLMPLEPRYVSTVDSGNLAAALLTVKQGSLELLAGAAFPAQLWNGYLDTLAVLREVVERAAAPQPAALMRVLDDIERCVAQARPTPSAWRAALARLLSEHSPALDRELVALLESFECAPGRMDSARRSPALLPELRAWLTSAREHLERMQREMDLLLPWLEAWQHAPSDLVASLPRESRDAWRELESIGSAVPTVTELPAVVERARRAVARVRQGLGAPDQRHTSGPRQLQVATDARVAGEWCAQLDGTLTVAAQAADYLRARLEEAATRAEAFARAMDFGFLYDPQRKLFFIGYNVSAARIDEHHYDLLASEARLASFLAIANGAVPEEHWLHLGRPIGQIAGRRALLSWSGTMFEYLMPPLLLREGETTLIGLSCRAAVREQIDYARRRGTPWGISESGYYQFDAQRNYQYRAFGVPALGFKRGLDEDLVIAPYASLLALSLAPVQVVENLVRLDALGMVGRYGLYEAIDFTAGRQTDSEPPPMVRSFMAHHQGMVLAALDNFLNQDALVRRFCADPVCKTAELLLYERPPREAPVEQAQLPRAQATRTRRRAVTAPWAAPLDAPFPHVHVLSNGRYTLLATETGGGGSRWRNTAVSRWSPDPTLDADGFRIYLQDQADGAVWSPFREPGGEPASRRTQFAPHLVEYEDRSGGLTARQRIIVAADDDVEIRHLTLTSAGRRRRVAVVGYGEVVLGDAANDRRHPAFSKLFVESEYVADAHALVFHRRPRTPGEPPLYLVHTLALPRSGARALGFDSARDVFLGRAGTARAPAALARRPLRLSGTHGATLDPAMVLAASIDLPPHRTRELAFITAVAGSRDAALELARRYRSLDELEWTGDLAGQRAEEALVAAGIDPRDLPAMTTLLSLLLYPHPLLRAAPDVLARNPSGRSALWRHALSGDLPILLVRVGHAPHAPLLPAVVHAQAFWCDRGVAVDLVILNEHGSSYDAHVDDQVLRAIADAGAQGRLHQPGGGIFPLQADQMSDAERTALLSAARIVLDGAAESLAEQLSGRGTAPAALPPLVVTAAGADQTPPLPRPGNLQLDNGFGGFSADGSEYVIHLDGADQTPAPWGNVIANPHCGFVVTERGGGHMWVGSSGENRLTPWSNDPVTDEPGESIYLRDEETGAVWSPTPAPAGAGGTHRIRHGIGYTVFEHRCRDLDQQLRVFVPSDDPVKITELQITNRSTQARRLTVTYYVEWVLGTHRAGAQPFVIPAFDPESETLTARNPWNEDFGAAVAFVAAGTRLHGFTADRTEFLGRHGDRARPAALTRIGLAGNLRPGVDPCAALQVHIDLPAEASRTVHFVLGEGDAHGTALELARRYRDPAAVQTAWEQMRAGWEALLGAQTVRSPDPALDLMLNRWLAYQTLSARVWGRAGFYQSGGAFGFRDQLQDVAALAAIAPQLCRDQLIEAAAHQFEEGDVLHWWHPASGAGVRTRCSDDLVWLPYVAAHYVESSGDRAVLSVTAPYLAGEPLPAGDVERYARFAPAGGEGTLYDHCVRALVKANALGAHGLPLIGSGDWNDGMNEVGARGRGESVWLGWFLCATLQRFAPLCEAMGEPARAEELRGRADALATALDRSSWDGRWYRRGYYDDGTPLGSARRDECRIDAIAQAWAVLSGVADPHRARLAMDAVQEHLVREREQLLLLLTPPFDRSAQQPGYIKGYPPGVRENGGQYTHGAIWAAWAFAALGDADRAARLFANLLPVQRTATAEGAGRYRVEPYAIAADIYAGAHAGRGGWTWYTGSAGWAYRFGWEMLLGLRSEAVGWRIEPSLPSHWPGCSITLRDQATTYEIDIVRPAGASRHVASVELDGTALADNLIPRLRDGTTHRVVVVLQTPVARTG